MSYCLIFLIDFVSKWFKHYSIYLAGERKEVVSNDGETSFLNIAEMNAIDLVIYTQFNIWLSINYAYKFPAIFGPFFPVFGMGESLGLMGLGTKVLVNIIELKQGWHRIVDYDVEIKNRQLDKAATDKKKN